MPEQYLDEQGNLVDETEPYLDDDGNLVVPGKSVRGFISNIGTSGVQMAGDLANMVLHPIDTATGLGRMAAHPIDSAKAIGGHLADRYGSLDAIGNTLYEDPVGAAADLSTLIGGVGLGAKVAQAPKLARIAARASSAINPLNVPLKLAAPLGQAAGRGLMQKALKPSKAVTGGKPENVNAIVNTMLEEGLNPTGRGYRKADELVGTLHDEVVPQVQEAARLGVNIDPAAIANVDRAKKAFLGVDPAADLKRIEGVRTRFLAAHPDPIPIDDAFEMLKKEGKILHDKFGEQKASVIEAKKDIRHAGRNEVRDVMEQAGFDEFAPKMDRQRDILQAIPAIADRARVGGNLNPLGLAPLAHSPLGFASFLMDRAPMVVGSAARGAYNLDHPSLLQMNDALLRAALLRKLGAASNSQSLDENGNLVP
jgi:hypothetical protein